MPTLAELAAPYGLEAQGGNPVIDGVCSLKNGRTGGLAFFNDPKRLPELEATQASAVIVTPSMAAAATVPVVIAKDPYLAYARLAGHFDTSLRWPAFVHPSAVVEGKVGEGCFIGALAFIEAGASVEAGCYIGAGCTVEAGASLGAGSRLEAKVSVGRGVRIGRRALILPGAVIGSRGFGNARDPHSVAGWLAVPQLGTVVVGDDVEIGANTTIDRGALDDTVLGNGVRLDNQVHIAHNTHIGDFTAMAGCSASAGSVVVGKNCLIGGGTCLNGHIHLADNVVILGMGMVTKSINEAGIYGSGLPAAEVKEWHRTIARVRRLEKLELRIKALESVGKSSL
jgi:UDP-3-O-[3-hydroxymyristoyl] glucosamine N-acyltransferase